MNQKWKLYKIFELYYYFLYIILEPNSMLQNLMMKREQNMKDY